MRIIQVLTTISYGDAVSNDCLSLYESLKNNGYESAIYAENIDARIKNDSIKRIEKISGLDKDDIIIYHLSTGTELNNWIKKQNCKKIMIYHNITPPDYFRDYNMDSCNLCQQGVDQVKGLNTTFDYVIAVSEYNKSQLLEMGYNCPIDVLPILIPFDDYKKKPNKLTTQIMQDGYTNIIFVGRIAPNKKQEDVISVFKAYKEFYNPKSRLVLVGSYNGMEKYYQRLRDYVKKLDVQDVIFTGHIKFDSILAYYNTASVFLCMSEHEGFCVPLVESMFFDVPIVAYNSSAIAGTLNGSGVLINERNNIEIAGVIDKIINDEKLKNTIISNQRERLLDFDNKKIEAQFQEYLNRFINGEVK